MVWRHRIAALLAGHSQLEARLTDKDLHRLLGRQISLVTIKRHRLWLRQARAEGRLQGLLGCRSVAHVTPKVSDASEVIFD